MQKNAPVMNIFTILDDCIKPPPPSAFSVAPRLVGNCSICKRSNIGSPKLLKEAQKTISELFTTCSLTAFVQASVREICFYSYDPLSKYNAGGYKNAFDCFL